MEQPLGIWQQFYAMQENTLLSTITANGEITILSPVQPHGGIIRNHFMSLQEIQLQNLGNDLL